MTCPICHTEILPTEYINECARHGGSFWCPKGCKLQFEPTKLTPVGEVAELERMYQL